MIIFEIKNSNMSDYIQRKANQIVDYHISHGIGDPKKLIGIVRDELYEIRSDKDKLLLLTTVLEANDSEYNKHLLVCKNKTGCSTNQDHEQVAYYLGQELSDLGIELDEDAFTREEKYQANEILDNILQEIKDLKDGQQLIYDDLIKEIEELKNWYILGKKKWSVLCASEIGNAVASGVIAEATAKPILGFIKDIPKYLNI